MIAKIVAGKDAHRQIQMFGFNRGRDRVRHVEVLRISIFSKRVERAQPLVLPAQLNRQGKQPLGRQHHTVALNATYLPGGSIPIMFGQRQNHRQNRFKRFAFAGHRYRQIQHFGCRARLHLFRQNCIAQHLCR